MKKRKQKQQSDVELPSEAATKAALFSGTPDCADYVAAELNTRNKIHAAAGSLKIRNRNKGHWVWLPTDVEQAISELVEYHWSDEMEDCEEERKNGYDGPHFFNDKLLVNEWLSDQATSWTRTRKVQMVTDVLLLVGICLLGLLSFRAP